MSTDDQASSGTSTLGTTTDLTFDDAVGRAREALAEQGFGVLTEIDLAGTLKKKIDAEMPRYLILGACHPASAHRAVQADPRIGVMLPCNVVVRETRTGGPVEIMAFDPMTMAGPDAPDEIRAVATDVAGRLGQVVDALR